MANISMFRVCLLMSVLTACADTDGGESELALPGSPANAEAAAEGVLLASMTLNSVVNSAFGRVKADLEADPLALYGEIDRALQEQGRTRVEIIEAAARELLPLAQQAEEERLALDIYASVMRLAEVISSPREGISWQRLGNYLDDATLIHSRLDVKFYAESPERRRSAYYFAPAYNVVTSTQIVAMAADTFERSTIELVYKDAIEFNERLVGSGEADDLGYLSDWVASQTPGSASMREKNDKDPIVYSVRRALAEQQRALD